MAFCQSCGASLSGDARFCQACGRGQPGAVAPPGAAGVPEKYGIAALLSFFLPGLGQIIKGHVGKALLIWFGLIVFGILCIFLIGIPFVIALWFWQIYDAYNSPQTA